MLFPTLEKVDRVSGEIGSPMVILTGFFCAPAEFIQQKRDSQIIMDMAATDEFLTLPAHLQFEYVLLIFYP